MARTFGCDPQAAGQVSKELAQIRSDMKSLGRVLDGYHGATGSPPIQRALEEFFSHSSDNRKKMDGLLERASGLLAGLAEGTGAVDKSLTDSLAPAGGQPQTAAVAPAATVGR
ncbi:MAG: hypothetical protein ACRDRU_09020 [Pseudonocardiaceae bacterium]